MNSGKLPYRANLKDFPVFDSSASPHLFLETLFDRVVEPCDHALTSYDVSALDHYKLQQKVEAGLVSLGQAAVIFEGVLKGETANGGVEQFFFNRPFLAIEGRFLVDRFASEGMADLYRRLTEKMADAVKTFPTEKRPFDYEAFEAFRSLGEQLPMLLEEFDGAFVGQSRVQRYANDPVYDGSWGNDFAESIIAYALANKGDFVVLT